MPDHLPAIIVVAFSRPRSLKRILASLEQANYGDYTDIPLIISIDKSDCSDVAKIAKEFNWKYGKKEIIEHQTNLGLRKHVISCGDLTQQYESVIILEDDLMVSPGFYDYAIQAMHFYNDDEMISGIALYSYDYNDWVGVPFIPIYDGYDNYFFQCVTSWGQLWTRNQWNGFKAWYELNAHVPITSDMGVPDSVVKWPSSSWKKLFIAYMVLENKYFVYPRVSLTTNFGDPGTHFKSITSEYQVSLMLGTKRYSFSHLKDSYCIYDVFYELEANCLKILNPDLKEIDFECDLYGIKKLENIQSKHLISVRECSHPLKSYSIIQIPQELNIIFNVEGNFFNLARTSEFKAVDKRKQLIKLKRLYKGINPPQCRDLYFYILSKRLKHRLKTVFAKRCPILSKPKFFLKTLLNPD